MKPKALLGSVLTIALALAASVRPARALCIEPQGGFAIFQCNDLAYFAPSTTSGIQVPMAFDPNGRPTNVSAVFWQIGFGNGALETGGGTSGTGMAAASFNGNDSGVAFVDIQEGHFVHPGLPIRSLCLRSNNWGNQGIDGCCDNPRSPSLPMSDDNLLNPYFDVYAYSGYTGLYSLDWQQDYPMAMLLRESSGRYFAVAAVASLNRGNTGDPNRQDCSNWPNIPNPATCDIRHGFYNFNDVADGLTNILTSRPNVVPWQEVPQPQVSNVTRVDPNNPASDLTVDVAWSGAHVYSDLSVRPSTNPTMGLADPNFASGVGTSDIASMFPLVRYVIETAPSSDPNFASPVGSTETTDTSIAALPVPFDHCLRVRTIFGKRPQAQLQSLADCRVGRCGDIGYEVASIRQCPGGACVPLPEVCDGRDNDCDGVVDDNASGSGDPCNTGLQGVCATGTLRCQAGALVCEPPPAGTERCNGLDDDCDGQVDEGIPQSAEVCNGLDDDCDGYVDEGIVGDLCGYVCSIPAHYYCLSGQFVCLPDYPTPHDDETCNGVDDNCNGIVDEDAYPMGPCDTGQQGVCADGTLRCVSPAYTCVANQTPGTEICDGLDNDCDGSVDEGVPPGGSGDPDSDGICYPGDNCRNIYNPSQADRDADGVGDACDLTILMPPSGATVTCGSGKGPTISWAPYAYDRYQVSISNDAATPSFVSGKPIKVTSWTASPAKWREICETAGSVLYIRVAGEDLDVPSTDPARTTLSEAVAVTVVHN